MAILTLCIYSVLVAFTFDGVSSVIVHTENGRVNGTTFTTFQGRVVDAFLGIPYGKPPTKENRFKDPQPAEKWEGVRSADTPGSICFQLSYRREIAYSTAGDEDCLFLNIYTPSASNTSKLPVIVFIHGGCFMFGSGNGYTPYYLMDHRDFVFVTINYRLGPFGFISTEDTVIPGNFGLKDQVFALKWIRDHIAQFGGDGNKITITGNSAGGASVHLHFMSPLSKDLFKNGISESGTAFDPWAMAKNPLEKAETLSDAVGCPTNTSKAILDCLQKKDAVSIYSQIQPLFQPWISNPFSPFGPVVEAESSSAFLSKDPYTIIAEGKVKDAPWMTYITTEEGLYPAGYFITDQIKMQELDENWDDIAPYLLDYNYTVAKELQSEVSQKIRNFYLGKKRINNESRDGLVKLITDRLFGVGAEKSVRLQASVSKSPVYFFVFGFRGSYSVSRRFCRCDEYLGVSHVDSTIYLLNTGIISTNYTTEKEKETVERMVNIWTSFANSSVPFANNNFFVPPTSPDIGEVGNITYFFLSSTNEIRNGDSLTNRRFWYSLPIMENENKSHSVFSSSSRIASNIVSNHIGILVLLIIFHKEFIWFLKHN